MASKDEEVCTKLWWQLSCVQNQLLEGIEMVKQRRQLVEEHCVRCQKLFRPWPVKVYQGCSASKDMDEKPQTQEKEIVQESENKKEKQELAMLDEILEKAQQARHFQTKLSKSTKKTSSSERSSASNTGSKLSQPDSSATMETKPKVTYPVVSRPPSAKSTYSSSYKRVPKKKQFTASSRPTSGVSSMTKMAKSSQLAQKQEIGKASNNPQNGPPSRPKKPQLVEKPSSSQDKNSVDISAPTSEALTSTKDRTFLLLEKGPFLEIPQHFQIVCKKHRRLLNKIQDFQRNKVLNSPDNFAKEVEGTFCSKLLSSCGKTVYVRCDILGQAYEKLLRLAKESASTLREVNEEMPLEIASKAVMLWEFVTLKYKELENEFHHLTKDLDCCGNSCPCFEYHSQNLQDYGCSAASKSESILASVISSFATKSDFCYPTSNNEVFTYLNSEELKLLQKLAHEYKMKKFQLELRRTISSNILPLLNDLPTKHRNLNFELIDRLRYVYFASYTKLLTLGPFIPEKISRDLNKTRLIEDANLTYKRYEILVRVLSKSRFG